MVIIQNRTVWIMTIMSGLILLSLSAFSASASPQLPCEFYGNVTVSGTPAPAGTVITAYVNRVKQGSIEVKDPGVYGGVGTFDERLIVLSGENDFTGGAPTISFKIGDKTADQTSPYSPGMSSELALSSGGGAAATSSSTVNSQPVQATTVESTLVSQSQGSSVPVVTAVQTIIPAPQSTAQQPAAPAQLSITSAPGNETPSPVPVNTTAPVLVATPIVTVAPPTVAAQFPVNATSPQLSAPTPVPTSVPAPVVTVAPPNAPAQVSLTSIPANVTPVPAPVSNQSVAANVTVIPPVVAMPVNKTPAASVVQTNQTIPVNGSSSVPVDNVSVIVSFPSGQIITP